MGGKQTYGVHPFALVQTKVPGEFMGIYFRNTNAASPIITHNKDKDNVTTSGTISYITTGGQIEVFIFVKDNAKNIIKAYQNFVGKPSLPPFWALGWHATTTADPATNLQDVKDLVQGYADAGIPLESVWLDKSYMSNYKDFTVNTTSFNGLSTYTTDTLHPLNIKLGLVLGPSLSSVSEQDPLYADAQQSGALIESFVNPT
jgi:alpha-glucosidase